MDRSTTDHDAVEVEVRIFLAELIGDSVDQLVNGYDAVKMKEDIHQGELDDGSLGHLLCDVVEVEERIPDVDQAGHYDSPLNGRRAVEVEPKTYGTVYSTVMSLVMRRLGAEVTVRTW